MTYEDFVGMVRDMRAHQKCYHETKERRSLADAIHAERAVDNVLWEISLSERNQPRNVRGEQVS